MASGRNFIGSKGPVGSSEVVARSVEVLLSYSFDESYQSFEFAKVFFELFGELL
jgi:hypothetical protein